MLVKTSFGEYMIDGIYEHFKGNFYQILNVAKLHDSENIFIIVYRQCDKYGTYISIRDENGEVKVFQPFCTHETRWNDVVGRTTPTEENPEGEEIKRFKLI